MNSVMFNNVLDELKEKNGNTDYYMELSYQGLVVGCVYADGNLDDIEAEDRGDCVLVHNGTIGIFVTNAEVWSI